MTEILHERLQWRQKGSKATMWFLYKTTMWVPVQQSRTGYYNLLFQTAVKYMKNSFQSCDLSIIACLTLCRTSNKQTDYKSTLYEFFFEFHNCAKYWANGSARHQGPRGLMRCFTTTGLLGLHVRIPPGHRCVSGRCCVFSGRDPWNGSIPRPEGSYLLRRIWV